MPDMELTVIVSAAVGAALKTVWDAWVKAKADHESLLVKKRIDLAERCLAEFWWPLYFGLQKDTAIWQRILDRDHDNAKRRAVALSIEEHVILPNHRRLVELIESKVHLAKPDEALMTQLLAYLDLDLAN